MNKVTRIIELEHLRREPMSEGDEFDVHMARFRAVGEEQRQLLSGVTLEEFEQARDALFAIRVGGHTSPEAIASMSERCAGCGHRRGGHRSVPRRGCGVGGDRHNAHYKRSDPSCFCSGFTTAEEKAEAEREAAEEEARREAAPFKCDNCDEVFDDDCGLVRLYECGECGSIFSYEDHGSNRCEDCGKFAALMTDRGCPECEQGEVAEKYPAHSK